MRALFLALCLLFASAGLALAQPVLDGHNTGSATAGTTTTFTATTVATNEVLIAGAAVRATGTTNPNLTIAGCSLTWHALGTAAQFNNNSSKGTSTNSWYAQAPSTLSACTITVTSDQTIQNSSAGYCSFSGANVANPFDPHSGLPVSNSNATASTVAMAATMSTSLAHDTMVTVSGQVSANLGGVTATTGATICANLTNSGGLNFSNIFLVYKTFTAAQSGFSIGINASEPYWGVNASALTADAPAGHSRLIQ